MKRLLIGACLVALASLLPPQPAQAHAPAVCTKEAFERTYVLNAGADVVTNALEWVVLSFEYQFVSSHPEDHGIDGWKNNVIIRVYDSQVRQFVYTWASDDDKGWDAIYQHTRTFNGQPKPISVSRHPGSYIEFEAWFDKRNVPDVGCKAKIKLEEDPTKLLIEDPSE